MIRSEKKRADCKPLHLFQVEQNFLAALMDALPHQWMDTPAEELGLLVLEVLQTYKMNHPGRIDNGTLYDLFHRSGENQ